MTTLTVGFDAEYAPYGYKGRQRQYVGFDLNLAQEVCDRMGWELKNSRLTGMPRIWNSIHGDRLHLERFYNDRPRG